MSQKFVEIDDLENKVRSICKGSHSLYLSSMFKKYVMQICKMQRFFMNFWLYNIIITMSNLILL
jgi:hypothetical protein